VLPGLAIIVGVLDSRREERHCADYAGTSRQAIPAQPMCSPDDDVIDVREELVARLAAALVAWLGDGGPPDGILDPDASQWADGDVADDDSAIDISRRAVAITPVDHPDRALWLANLGWELIVRCGRTRSAFDRDQALSTVIGLLRTLTDHALSARDRQYHLRQLLGLAPSAALLTRTPTDMLRLTRPDLAIEFDHLRLVLTARRSINLERSMS
jgi:hypothetical protein